jgi:hypothetical protein
MNLLFVTPYLESSEMGGKNRQVFGFSGVGIPDMGREGTRALRGRN